MAEIIESKEKSKAKDIARRFFKHENTPLLFVLIALIFIMGFITGGKTLSFTNIKNNLITSSIMGMASLGQGMVILTSGIDLSVGGMAMFSSVLGAGVMATNWQNIIGNPLPVAGGAAVMLLAGLGWGSANGILVSRVGMPALIVTLGMWQIIQGSALGVSGGHDTGWQPDALLFFGSGNILGVPTPVVIFIVVAVVLYLVLKYTTYGRSVYAVGNNPSTAWLSGVNVKMITYSVYAVAGVLSGLSAFTMLGRMMFASNRSLKGLEIDSIASATVGGISLMGGRGTVIGIVLGTLIMGVIDNSMTVMNADPATHGIVKGAIIIFAVVIDYIRQRRRGI